MGMLLLPAVLALSFAIAGCTSTSFAGSGRKSRSVPEKREQAPSHKDEREPDRQDQGAQSIDEDERESTRPARPGVNEQVVDPATDLGQDVVTPETPVLATPPDNAVVVPDNAVTQGSFTVWTVPADPAPAESYEIHIEVKIPGNVTSYSKEDLSGSVLGTDGYRQQIGRDNSGAWSKEQPFTFANGRGHLVLYIPGALELVKDTISVRSDQLNEQQTIAIVF